MIGLEYIRKQFDMPLSDLAKKLNISRQFISKWERGEKKIPSKYLPVLSDIFAFNTEYFQKELTEDDKFKIQEMKFSADAIAHDLGFDDSTEIFRIRDLMKNCTQEEVADQLSYNKNFMKLYARMKKLDIAMQLRKIHDYVNDIGKNDIEIFVDNQLEPCSPEIDKLVDIYIALNEIIKELIEK